MLKKYLIVFAILFLLQPVQAKETRIIQVSDVHFTSAGQNNTNSDTEYSESILLKTIKDINTIKDKSFVIFTGDNIDKAKSEDLKAFLKIANKLNCPYYVVIGNHDVSKYQKLSKKEYMNIVSKYSKNWRMKNPNYEFKKDGIVFLVADGAKEAIPGTSGYFRENTLKWLDRTLKKHEKDSVVIFQHFPIEAPFFSDKLKTYDAEGYKTILDKHHNVIAIISGHYHTNSEKMSDGIYHISSPALLESPHDYKIIDIKNNGKSNIKIYTQTRHVE